MNPKLVVRRIRDGLIKESPTILTGLSIAGFATTIKLTMDAAPKATRMIDILREDRHKDAEVEGFDYVGLTMMEKIEATWKIYIPVVAMGITTVACIVGATTIHSRRYAALAGLYSLAEAGIREYKDKIVEQFGEKKAAKIDEEIIEDRMAKSNRQVVLTGKGETLCWDSLSGRYFKSSAENIRRVQNTFNQALITEMYMSLNELYDDLGLEHTELGDDLGWTVEYGLLEFIFDTKMSPEEEPCLVLKYKIRPKHKNVAIL